MRYLTKLTFAGVAALGMTLGAATASAEGTLNVYNWAEYIAEDTISNFEEEFDVEVTYDHYDSVETADAKLLAGNSGYDVVSHSGTSVSRLIPANILMELDTSRLPNFKHMSPEIMAQVDKWDPGNKHFVPFMWGTHGVTYNAELVASVHPDAPIGSLDLIFKPEHMEKLAECGVSFLDSPGDIVPMALAYLGLDPNSTNKDDYKQAEEMLLQIRPYISGHLGAGRAARHVGRRGSQHRRGPGLLPAAGPRRGQPLGRRLGRSGGCQEYRERLSVPELHDASRSGCQPISS
jgi:putrescine transport system substrate-binding protein